MAEANQTYLRFPLDLDDEQQGHLMKIDIYPSGSLLGSTPRNTSSVSSICLFIPGGGNGGPLQWEMVHDYDEVKLTKLGMGMIGGVTKTVAEAGLGAARLAGQGVINPKVDVLYSNSQLRRFMFSYFMSPSSAKENESMKAIIKSLRKYSCPELALGSGINQQSALKSGFWFVPPAEFQIEFWYLNNGSWQINPSLHKIGRCVLERIDVNYTQQGEFSTFVDGSPITVQLTMQFREMRIISQQDVEIGY